MDVNGINSNINSVNNTQGSQLERVSSSPELNKTSDGSSALELSDSARLQRSDLSQSLQNLNQGIALTKVASNGLESQKEILGNIKDKLIQVNDETTSVEDKEIFKQEVSKLVDDFKAISETTKFANQNLINQTGDTATLDILTADETISIEIPNTGQIANDISALVNGTNFNNGNVEAIVERVDLAVNQVDDARDNFESTGNQLEINARSSITAEINESRTNSALTDIDFGKETTDFSKANILTQLGYLVSTQANAAQDHNVKLLV